jgi:hypothetical protein
MKLEETHIKILLRKVFGSSNTRQFLLHFWVDLTGQHLPIFILRCYDKQIHFYNLRKFRSISI